MADYKTPGVYVVEKDSFGSSIVANETAIPVFIGFTEKAVQSNGQELNYMKGSDSVREPVMVSSTMEYESTFGGPDETGIISVLKTIDSTTNKTNYTATNMKDVGGALQDYDPGLMYPSVSNYFANGGGPCYIVSIGNYNDFSRSDTSPVDIANIEKAIEQAEQSTLLLPTDLIRYGESNYYSWGSQFTDYAGEGDQKKYFTILDVIQSNPDSAVFNEQDITDYRENVGTSEPSFAAAYYPYLKSLTSYAYNSDLSGVYLNGYNLQTRDDDAVITDYIFFSAQGMDADGNIILEYAYLANTTGAKSPEITFSGGGTENSFAVTDNTMTITFMDNATADQMNTAWQETLLENPSYSVWTINFLMSAADPTTTEIIQDGNYTTAAESPADGTFQAAFTVEFDELLIDANTDAATSVNCSFVVNDDATSTQISYDTTNGFVVTAKSGQTANDIVGAYKAKSTDGFTIAATDPTSETTLDANIAAADVDSTFVPPNNAQTEEVKTFLATNYINMPPSPFMAGIYSKVDNASGVWTPPANIAPTGISGPVIGITSKQQEDMNVDATAGKSINAIRSFTGKGTLVWGARTNNGNSQDWRYINVRRLFNAMETDISMALEAYVFKPNVHNTWVEVKTMIQSYLYGLYTDGAFAGTTPDGSYQVLIGLGETMTEEDVLDGYMRVSIMVAPVRPAEFIVLTFSQMVGQ